RPATRLGLRRDDPAASVAEFLDLLGDVDGPMEKVDAAPGESGEFAEAEPGEGGEQDHGSPARFDRLAQGVHLGQSGDGTFLWPLDSGALENARVLHNQFVLDGRAQDGP